VRFYFPDSQDLVSPTYDFVRDEYSPVRVRQRDDRYAHEVLASAPYHGMLVSKAIVDGSATGSAKYSMPQRERIYRLGVRQFFRLPAAADTLGDCGAFNYIDERIPPYSVDEVLDFYEGCGFDAGISVDHVILAYDAGAPLADAPEEWRERRLISLRLADKFLNAVQDTDSPVVPVGAAQGWGPASYADSVAELQKMGYERIALGGMVALKTRDILACLQAIDAVRSPQVELHLLGVTRVDAMAEFSAYGVSSFDSTSPFRQAFMDDRNNYYAPEGNYVALRVPQVDGNPALKRNILAGRVSQRAAVSAERECLRLLRAFDKGLCTAGEVLDVLTAYEAITNARRSYAVEYARTLHDCPWKQCSCSLCREHGIEMVIFRGTERNKRRGFHNLSVFKSKLDKTGLEARERIRG
jgi:hypothetical protein